MMSSKVKKLEFVHLNGKSCSVSPLKDITQSSYYQQFDSEKGDKTNEKVSERVQIGWQIFILINTI